MDQERKKLHKCLAIETACGIRLFFFVVDCGISQHPVLSEIIIITPIQLGVCSGLDNSVNNGLKFNNGLKESEFFIHLKCIFRDYIVVDIIGAVSNLNLMLSLSGLTSTHDGFLMLNLKAKLRGAGVTSAGMVKRELKRVICEN
ncbi:hypothetical protein DY000_02013078 [Brassica cretica]|uniref:Plant bHLH transcription factor ACT-like domain-containing protein n=1 Tax=Brassica cretica TaxID=69181 RepID=A0ABQ7DB69_BRACR|nr:hypothetical protein DY000_02013078 [Brassica cretica]